MIKAAEDESLVEALTTGWGKEEVKAVLAALKFPEEIYNSLSKSVQQKIQKKLVKLYGNDQEVFIYIYRLVEKIKA